MMIHSRLRTAVWTAGTLDGYYRHGAGRPATLIDLPASGDHRMDEKRSGARRSGGRPKEEAGEHSAVPERGDVGSQTVAPGENSVDIDGVRLRLGHPDASPGDWIGQREVLKQLLACWLIVDPQDLPLTP